MDELAGKLGTIGAVGAPDVTQLLVPAAHCDDGDYLDTPDYAAEGQSQAAAKQNIENCILRMEDNFTQGISLSGSLVDGSGILKGDEVDLTKACDFYAPVSSLAGRAKCNVFQSFGAVLHGVQDFYAHSNWADQADPAHPISVTNPPGLNLAAPSNLLDLKDGTEPAIPDGLITGYYAGPGLDDCYYDDSRVTHACLNKDDADITVDPGQADNGKVAVNTAGTPTDKSTTERGQVGNNEQKAVTAAIVETRRQWADFRTALAGKYGAADARTMILALTQDTPKVDLVFAIDTTGSMTSYINDVVSDATSIISTLTGGGSSLARPVDFRIGLVDYKDADSCSDYDAHTDLDFTSDTSLITQAINSLPGMVGGGCDIPEDMLSGINTALGFPWRSAVSKAVVVMGDAPGKDPEPHSGLTSDAVIDKANALDPVSIYPVLVGTDPDATAFVTKLATGTGGQVFNSSTAGGAGAAIVDAITAIAAAPPAGDVTPPAVTVSFPAAPDGQNGTFNAAQKPVTGTVTATDTSGVAAISCLDGAGGLIQGALKGGGTGTASAQLTVSGDGEHVIECTATDASPAGNSGAADGSISSAALLIDTAPPTMACSVSPAVLTPANGRLVSVTAKVTVDDSFSGPGTFALKSAVSSEPDTDDSIQGFTVGAPSTAGQLRAESGSTGRTYTLTYQGSDAAGNTATCAATVTVAAAAADRPPVAAGDSYSTAEGDALSVPAPGVLVNDSDPDAGDTVTAIAITQPRHGTLTLNADGSFSYEPAATFTGTDTFTYEAKDSSGRVSAPATASITVTAPAATRGGRFLLVATGRPPLVTYGELQQPLTVTSSKGKVTSVSGTASYKDRSGKTRTVTVSVKCTRGKCSAVIKYNNGTSTQTFSGTGAVKLLRNSEITGIFSRKASRFGFDYAPKPTVKPKR